MIVDDVKNGEADEEVESKEHEARDWWEHKNTEDNEETDNDDKDVDDNNEDNVRG